MLFYCLRQHVGAPYETRANALTPKHIGEVIDCQTCPVCAEPQGSLPWLPPHRAEVIAYGRALGDVAFTVGMELVVSDRFREAWETNNLRGLSFTNLERLRVRPARFSKQHQSYFHVAVRYFSTKVDLSRSRIEYDGTITCDLCKNGAGIRSMRGFTIDEGTWTGEDVFVPWGVRGTIVVTERVRQLRDDYGLTNVNLIPVELYCTTDLGKWYIKGQEPDE